MGTGTILTKLIYELLRHKKLTVDEIKEKMPHSSLENIRKALFRLHVDNIVEPHLKADKKHRKFVIEYSLKKTEALSHWLDSH